MSDPVHTDPRPPAADGERALPEEIALAIERFRCAARDETRYPDGANMSATASARLTLTTSILSRLTAAEAGREEAERELTTLRRVHRWNVEHRDGEVLVCRNNHDKGDDCDWERFVPEERLTDAEAERDEALRISAEALELVRKHAIEALAAETARDAALARVEKLEKALAPFVAHADLYADWLRKAIAPNPSNEAFEAARSALTEAQPKGDR